MASNILWKWVIMVEIDHWKLILSCRTWSFILWNNFNSKISTINSYVTLLCCPHLPSIQERPKNKIFTILEENTLKFILIDSFLNLYFALKTHHLYSACSLAPKPLIPGENPVTVRIDQLVIFNKDPWNQLLNRLLSFDRPIKKLSK